VARPRHVYLIDGSGFIFRAYHAMPPLTRPDGTPVGAVLGFTNMLLKLRQETDADHIAVVFDVARKTFRNRIYPDYKAQPARAARGSDSPIRPGARGGATPFPSAASSRRITRPTI
jgi:5'-3' exonuclease